MTTNLIYEVECQLDPDIVADYDAWLPGPRARRAGLRGLPGRQHRECRRPRPASGSGGASATAWKSAAALDHYLENDATRLRTETAQRFGGRVQCERRVLKPRHELAPRAREPARCLNCGTVVDGRHCAQCGQAADVHVLSMKEVAGDVTHSLLHLDSRVWRTVRLLLRRPGELTREFIAGRHQLYIPPFRLYLAISILFFALSALLPESGLLDVDAPVDFDDESETVAAKPAARTPAELKEVTGELRKELAAEGVPREDIDKALEADSSCKVSIFDDTPIPRLREDAQARLRTDQRDGGKLLAERFATTAPKLMFLFLPLMAGGRAALLLAAAPAVRRAPRAVPAQPRLHVPADRRHAILDAIAELKLPLSGVLGLVKFLLWSACLATSTGRCGSSMARAGRKTLLKFFAISTIYFVLLGVTMLGGPLVSRCTALS